MTCTGVGLSKAPRSVERRPGSAWALRALGGLGGHFWAPHLLGPGYFRWSQGPSGIHLARFVVNSSGHTVTSEPFCHWSM